jgi:hypothetical protein
MRRKEKKKHMGNCPFYRSVIVNAGRPFSAIAALSETLTSKNSSLSHKRENAKRRGGGEGMLLPPLFSSFWALPIPVDECLSLLCVWWNAKK